MLRIFGVADDEKATLAYVQSGHFSACHGKASASGKFRFVAIVNAKQSEIFSLLDHDARLSLLSSNMDDPAETVVAQHMVAADHKVFAAGAKPKVREVLAALHAENFTHLFDPRLG